MAKIAFKIPVFTSWSDQHQNLISCYQSHIQPRPKIISSKFFCFTCR